MILYTGGEEWLSCWPGEYREMELDLGNGSRLVVAPTDMNRARVVRLISTDPAAYLDPGLQPGRIIEIDFRI